MGVENQVLLFEEVVGNFDRYKNQIRDDALIYIAANPSEVTFYHSTFGAAEYVQFRRGEILYTIEPIRNRAGEDRINYPRIENFMPSTLLRVNCETKSEQTRFEDALVLALRYCISNRWRSAMTGANGMRVLATHLLQSNDI